MSSTILITIVSLSLLAFLSAVILYFVAQKFKVYEDPRIDDVQALLPAANCEDVVLQVAGTWLKPLWCLKVLKGFTVLLAVLP